MKPPIAIGALLAAFAIGGCFGGATGEVATKGVESKEEQMRAATEKLVGEKVELEGQR